MSKLALVAYTQHHENYAIDANGDICGEHWKAKGGDDLLIEVLDHTDAMRLGTEGLVKKVNEAIPEHNEYFRVTLLDWELIELTDEIVKNVKELIDSANDVGFARYNYGNTALWNWAVTQLSEEYQNISYY